MRAEIEEVHIRFCSHLTPKLAVSIAHRPVEVLPAVQKRVNMAEKVHRKGYGNRSISEEMQAHGESIARYEPRRHASCTIQSVVTPGNRKSARKPRFPTAVHRRLCRAKLPQFKLRLHRFPINFWCGNLWNFQRNIVQRRSFRPAHLH